MFFFAGQQSIALFLLSCGFYVPDYEMFHLFFFLLLLKCLTDLLFTVKELLFTVALKLKSLNEKTF